MLHRDHFIGVAMGWGAQIGGCQDAPAHLLQQPFFKGKSTTLLTSGADVHGDALSIEARLVEIRKVNRAAADRVFRVIANGERPVVIGGDHSIAVGTWNGVRKALNADLGLIWIDAHMDAHTFATTPSYAPHGMPIAGLLGYGTPSLAALFDSRPVIKPQHLCLVGIRSYEPEEYDLLHSLGVRIFFEKEVQQRGMQACLDEAMAISAQAEAGFGVSVDLDVFSTDAAPGVGSREPGGVEADAVEAMDTLWSHSSLQALEFVEYNHHRDRGGITRALLLSMLARATSTDPYSLESPRDGASG